MLSKFEPVAKATSLVLLAMTISCTSLQPPPAAKSNGGSNWHLMLAHDAEGGIKSGSTEQLIAAVRNGCDLRVAWGARRRADPAQTIEHISSPVWVSIRNSGTVEVQLDDFLINHRVLGEPEMDHPQREPFGGTTRTVMWRSILKTDGSFDAIWYSPQTGELVNRVPQQHPMRWYADCEPSEAEPLFD